MEAGITVTSVNPLYTEGELKRQFVNAEAECLITIPKLKDVADKIGSHLPGYKGTITVGEGGQWDLLDLSDPNRTFEPLSTSPNAHDMALLPYSSGTTGLPKGVQLTHSNCVANIQQIMHPKFLDLQPASDSHQDIAVGVIPFFHIYGCTALLCVTMKFGMHTITLPNFTPESYVKCLEKYKPTALFLVPTLMMFLAKHPSVKREHLSSVKAVMCGAAPATKALIDLFKEKAGKSDITVQQGYGMTESSPCTLITPYDMPESKIGSAGILVPNTEAKVVCMTTGKDLPPNNQGELYVRGPQVMSGYLKNDEATKEALDSDKWLHTGDVAYYDDEGYFFITNRTKELIKVKGNQGSAKKSNIDKIQSKTLHIILDAPWYAPNRTIHNDLNIPTVYKVAQTQFRCFHTNLESHSNPLINALSSYTKAEETVASGHVR
ncbi:hypothetical protein AAG570_008598 [Ranatra chinensis]|uniref:AMP-dependent synthetase/ligase domain-containing protein n=1 Tax=Ranatra chinensis TaxID=642074 RepID=A0ABD0YRN2_9HEMI